MKKMIITLPNVHEAMQLQGVDMSAIFIFAGCKKRKQNTQPSASLNVQLKDEADSYSSYLFDNSTCEINNNEDGEDEIL